MAKLFTPAEKKWFYNRYKNIMKDRERAKLALEAINLLAKSIGKTTTKETKMVKAKIKEVTELWNKGEEELKIWTSIAKKIAAN